MLVALWPGWKSDWEQELKISFDGISKRIYIHPEVSNLDVKADVYSAWKRWVALRDNLKFEPAIRSVGGDPLGGGQYAGDMYFLMNGWRVVVDHAIEIVGVLYTDEGLPAFVASSGSQVVRANVSNLVLTHDSVVGTPPEDVWSYLIEGGFSAEQIVRLLAAALAGKVSGAGGSTINFRDLLDTKNRIAANVDPNGNRTSVALDAD